MKEVKNGMAKVKENADDAKSLFLMIGGNYITYYGNTGRFAMVHNDFGFTSVDTTTEVTGFHGAEVNAEYVMTQNPEVILLLNRDAAIGSEESASATDAFLNNDMIQKTTAYKNDNIIQLDSVAWYIISAALFRMLFILPTHCIGLSDFNCSHTLTLCYFLYKPIKHFLSLFVCRFC